MLADESLTKSELQDSLEKAFLKNLCVFVSQLLLPKKVPSFISFFRQPDLQTAFFFMYSGDEMSSFPSPDLCLAWFLLQYPLSSVRALTDKWVTFQILFSRLNFTTGLSS